MTRIITESDQKHYSIAIPFIDEEKLLFQVRSDKLSRQPGDVCFPGGAVEEGESPEKAVKRELKEELLITEEQIILPKELLITEGQITLPKEEFLLINDTAIIHCFPCRIHGYEGSFNPDEVSEVFSVPVTFFKNTEPKIYEVVWKPFFTVDFPFGKIHSGRNYEWHPRKSKIRFYEYEGRVIWGMTARIIENYALHGNA